MEANELFENYVIFDADGTTVIDFSEIPAKYFTLFFDSILGYCIKNVDQLCLNCEKRREFENQHPNDSSLTYTNEITNSIAIKYKKQYSQSITTFLISLFQTTRKLKSLTLSSLDLNHDQLMRIVKEITKCKTLQKLALVDLSLQDDGVRELCASTHHGLKNIHLVDCDVTEKSIQYIKSYLKQNQFEAFDIKGETFDEQSNLELKKAIQESHNNLLHSSNDENPEDYDELEQLRKENQKLAERIRAIREIANPFEYTNNVFVIGPGSKSFLNYLMKLAAKQAKILKAQDDE